MSQQCPIPECPLEKRLNRLEEKLDRLGELYAEFAGMLPSMCRRIDKMEIELWGNGRIGLVSRVYIIATLWALGGAGTFGLAQLLVSFLR